MTRAPVAQLLLFVLTVTGAQAVSSVESMPGGSSVAMHRIDLTGGAVLEKDCVYIVPLLEHLALRKRVSAMANPKSSIGRLDVFARVITDQGSEFDRIREGYKGPIYAELSPRAFSVLVRTGSRLVQLRIRRGSPLFRDTALRRLNAEISLVEPPAGAAQDPLCRFASARGALTQKQRPVDEVRGLQRLPVDKRVRGGAKTHQGVGKKRLRLEQVVVLQGADDPYVRATGEQ